LKTFPTQLELELNMEAALNDVPIHFEVMMYHAIQDVHIWNWGPNMVPVVDKLKDKNPELANALTKGFDDAEKMLKEKYKINVLHDSCIKE